MAARTAWFGGLGAAVLDPGKPVGTSAAVAPDGTVGAASAGVTGYLVITADSLDAAVEVYESFEVM